MKNIEQKKSKNIGINMMKLLTTKEVAAVCGAKGPVPSSGGNPTTNVPRHH